VYLYVFVADFTTSHGNNFLAFEFLRKVTEVGIDVFAVIYAFRIR
jgi:hypothetical protein